MSSGQWEVVGKSKKNKGEPPKKLTKAEKKKFMENAPKVEDILPRSEVKTLYSAFGKENKNAKIQQEKPKEKEVQKKPQKKTEPKPEPKPKPPKSIESAFNLMKVSELKSILELGKQRFPEAPLVWLKDLAAFINSRAAVEGLDPVFSGRSVDYPLCAVPSGFRDVLEKSLKEAGTSNSQLFFDVCLAAMANDMTKGAPVIGYKIFLQLLIRNNPSFVINSLNKSLTLKNSYQNRQPVGLSVLWALGQVGMKDINAGITVFQEIMQPMIEMKNYSRYIITYLKQLVDECNTQKFTCDTFIEVLDIVNGRKLSISKDLQKELLSLNHTIKEKLLGNENNKIHVMIEPLFKRLTNQQYSNAKSEMVEIFIECLLRDNQTLSTWKFIYPKNISPSAILLTHINANWARISKAVNKKEFKELLKLFNATNASLIQKKSKEEGLQEANRSCTVLIEKMTVKRSFPWKTVTFLFILIGAGLVLLDSNKNGGFGSSNTGRFLKDIGVWNHGEYAFQEAKIYVDHGKVWIVKNGPDYYAVVKDFLVSYGQLIRDLGLIGYNMLTDVKQYAIKKSPIVLNKIEEYAPGLVDYVSSMSSSVWEVTKNYSCYYFSVTKEYLVTKVFVGQLSPENIQRITLEALNTTQVYATHYCNRVYEYLSNSNIIK